MQLTPDAYSAVDFIIIIFAQAFKFSNRPLGSFNKLHHVTTDMTEGRIHLQYTRT